MNRTLRNIGAIACSTLILSGLGCSKKKTDDSTTTGTISTGIFSPADIQKTWTTSCTAGSEIVTGANNYSLSLSLNSDGTFSYEQLWYTGACAGANYTIIYETSGTYSLTGLMTGSTTVENINFVVTYSDMMSMTTAAQTSVNSACGGTSPYHSGINTSYNGQHESTYMMTCSGWTTPNSGNDSVNNIVTLDNGVLEMGATYDGIPGVFAGSTVPTTTTVNFN